MVEQYEWKQTVYNNKESWTLTLFAKDKGRLRFLKKQGDIAKHKLEILTFEPKSLCELPRITEGNIDASLSLKNLSGKPQIRAKAYFLNGEFKEGKRFNIFLVSYPEEFKKGLTKYFGGDVQPYPFEKYFSKLINNSNLPQKQKDAVKGLL